MMEAWEEKNIFVKNEKQKINSTRNRQKKVLFLAMLYYNFNKNVTWPSYEIRFGWTYNLSRIQIRWIYKLISRILTTNKAIGWAYLLLRHANNKRGLLKNVNINRGDPNVSDIHKLQDVQKSQPRQLDRGQS